QINEKNSTKLIPEKKQWTKSNSVKHKTKPTNIDLDKAERKLAIREKEIALEE
ncbi:34629_t:CDS:1, partial [Racocetra persica]